MSRAKYQRRTQEEIEVQKEFLYEEYVSSVERVRKASSKHKEFILGLHKRKMALIIWEQARIKTGLISEELLRRIQEGEEFSNIGTEEHQNSGVMIRNLLFGDRVLSKEEFIDLMEDCRKVNLTLKTENKKLVPIQNLAKYGEHEECYRTAGIKLIKFSKVRQKKGPSKWIKA